jgi:hypothetical protein
VEQLLAVEAKSLDPDCTGALNVKLPLPVLLMVTWASCPLVSVIAVTLTVTLPNARDVGAMLPNGAVAMLALFDHIE